MEDSNFGEYHFGVDMEEVLLPIKSHLYLT